jgi:radical SAM protein with 4Fe4S-binding SPASM domain
MPFALFEKLCDQLRSLGTASMTISGEGEPFMHPEILAMISLAKNKGFSLSVFTNGTLLHQGAIEALIDSRLDMLKVSLWAASTEDYESLYPHASSTDINRIIESLRLITDLKIRRNSDLPQLKLHQPIDRRNYQAIGAMREIAEETGCDVLSFSPFKTQNHSFSDFLPSAGETKKILVSLKTCRKEISGRTMSHTIDTTLLRYKIGGAVWEKLPCYIGWLHVRIKPDGTVLPCNNYLIPMGNVNDEKIWDIWNQQGFRRFRENTLTTNGLSAIAGRFDCYYCCHVSDNLRVHRRYGWLAPFLNKNIAGPKN